MKKIIPYNSGELRKADGKNVVICGHIWWPVEKCNAYHCMVVDTKGQPQGDPQYIWDYSHGEWPVFVPEVA